MQCFAVYFAVFFRGYICYSSEPNLTEKPVQLHTIISNNSSERVSLQIKFLALASKRKIPGTPLKMFTHFKKYFFEVSLYMS